MLHALWRILPLPHTTASHRTAGKRHCQTITLLLRDSSGRPCCDPQSQTRQAAGRLIRLVMQSSMAVRLRSPATGTAAPHSCRPAVIRLHSAHRLLVNRQMAVQPTRATGADKSGGLQAASRLSVIGLSCRVADEHQRRPSPDVGCIYQTTKHGAIHASMHCCSQRGVRGGTCDRKHGLKHPGLLQSGPTGDCLCAVPLWVHLLALQRIAEASIPDTAVACVCRASGRRCGSHWARRSRSTLTLCGSVPCRAGGLADCVQHPSGCTAGHMRSQLQDVLQQLPLTANNACRLSTMTASRPCRTRSLRTWSRSCCGKAAAWQSSGACIIFAAGRVSDSTSAPPCVRDDLPLGASDTGGPCHGGLAEILTCRAGCPTAPPNRSSWRRRGPSRRGSPSCRTSSMTT